GGTARRRGRRLVIEESCDPTASEGGRVTAAKDESSFKLAVLNPGGHDAEQYFDSPATPDSGAHAPVNFHGYAACTGGSFHRDTKNAIAEGAPILLLLRGNLKAAQQAMAACRNAGAKVVVSLKETGLHQA